MTRVPWGAAAAGSGSRPSASRQHERRAFAARLRVAEAEIADLVFRDVPGRPASPLLRLAEAYGRKNSGKLLFTLRLAHQDIASMIGACDASRR